MSLPAPIPRQTWMAVLARAPATELERLSQGLLPAYIRLRGPEIGLVMLQGLQTKPPCGNSCMISSPLACTRLATRQRKGLQSAQLI